MNKLERLREIESRYVSITSGCQWDSCQCRTQLANVRKEIEALEAEDRVVYGRDAVKCNELTNHADYGKV